MRSLNMLATLVLVTTGFSLVYPVNATLDSDRLGVSIPASTSGQRSSPDSTQDLQLRLEASEGLDPVEVYGRLAALESPNQMITRGTKEAELYAALATNVLMVLTNEGFGSGTIVGDASTVLTNWHVVKGYASVGIIYKPTEGGAEALDANVRLAQVVKVDEVADLALLKIEDPISDRPIAELGNLASLPVGSDVHAIGHPSGETWTYTKGIVSQIRDDYEWVTEGGKIHQAKVVQTQTPINPGNSGGPLFDDEHKLVGINSFKSDGEGLNFAVSVEDVERFLQSKDSRYAENTVGSDKTQSIDECEVGLLGTEMSNDESATITYIDINCDGKADGWLETPIDETKPMLLIVDTNGDMKTDSIYSDIDRDNQFDESYYDIDDDGEIDLVGFHRNGEMEPYLWEPYRG